jgi:transposase
MKCNAETIERQRAFLRQNAGLSTYDLAILSNTSASTIRNWKRRCGVASSSKPPFAAGAAPKKVPKVVVEVRDPAVWDNPAWFRQKYEVERIGMPTIARIIGRSPGLVCARLKRFKIHKRSLKDSMSSKSQFCNKAWLLEHYVRLGWPLKKCGAAAGGVSAWTVYNWLIRFQIAPRCLREAMAGKMNPFFGRKHTAETKERIRQSVLKLRAMRVRSD